MNFSKENELNILNSKDLHKIHSKEQSDACVRKPPNDIQLLGQTKILLIQLKKLVHNTQEH